MKSILNLFIIGVLLFLTQKSYSVRDEFFDKPKVVAVEPKIYNPKYDLTGQFSILPLDAFYKGYALGVSYTHSQSSSWAWEVVNFNLNSKSDTGLKQDLINNFSVRPQGILDHISLYGVTSAIYTPIYSKNLLFNEKILYGSFSFALSGGLASFSGGDMAPLIGGGFILRSFHSKTYSSKFDFRIYKHMASGKSSDLVMTLTYGLSYEFGEHAPWK